MHSAMATSLGTCTAITAAELELEKNVRVLFPPILQHEASDEGTHDDSSVTDSEPPSLHEKIASTICCEDPTDLVEKGSPHPLKVKGEPSQNQEQMLPKKSSVKIIKLNESAYKYEKQADELKISKKFAGKNFTLSHKGILQIFTRSLEQHLTVDKMWTELKLDATKRLRPIILHCHSLNRLASPSTRQCLEFYRKPTPIDKFTGKPIPLGQVLNQVKRRSNLSRGTMSILNSAMGRVVRYSQMRAEMMLDSHNQALSNVHQDWYFTASNLSAPHPSSGRRSSDLPSPAIRRIRKSGTPASLRRHLPLYLTNDGSMLSASLEELNGEILYCTPSANKSRPGHFEEEGGQVSKSSSVFLTDMEWKDAARQRSGEGAVHAISPQPSTTAPQQTVQQPLTTSSPSTTPQPPVHQPLTVTALHSATQPTVHQPLTAGSPSTTPLLPVLITRAPSTAPQPSRHHWQPLSSKALLDNNITGTIPIRGRGPQAHGHYSMWRPSDPLRKLSVQH